MQPREETFVLENGKGLIKIRRQDYASGLFIKGKPVVFNCDECSDSVIQEFYIKEYYSAEENIAEFRALIENRFALLRSDVLLLCYTCCYAVCHSYFQRCINRITFTLRFATPK
jgi:hypothetical protein